MLVRPASSSLTQTYVERARSRARGSLYDEEGNLDFGLLTETAREVMDSCVRWLEEVDRSMFLPIDLIVVLVRRDHRSLKRAIARAARGSDDFDELGEQLEALARRVERQNDGPARLHIDQFSLGFMGILDDAMTWARESERDQLSEADIARVVRWRAELQESASVRWAIRQLAQPGGEKLFDADGTCCAPASRTRHGRRCRTRWSSAVGRGCRSSVHRISLRRCARRVEAFSGKQRSAAESTRGS